MAGNFVDWCEQSGVDNVFTYTEIVSGLNAGDQVIISGYRDFAQADTIQLEQ